MEDNRLDLDAPLLSVRRYSATPQPPDANPLPPQPWRSVLPFYKSDLKSGPVRNPGVVPFVWEQKPGQPKGSATSRHRSRPAPSLPPGRHGNGTGLINPSRNPNPIRENKPRECPPPQLPPLPPQLRPLPPLPPEEEEEEDHFSDAVETHSRTESFYMNCSVSGISGIPDAADPSGSFSTDPQVRDFMMSRFLPAAQAMTTGSPQCAPRKPPNPVENGDRRLGRTPLPYQHRPNFVARYPQDLLYETGSSDGDEDDGEGNYDGSRHFASKACGFLPRLCLKSSFCLLNPMPGMKIEGRRRRLPQQTSWKIGSILQENKQLAEAEDELWKAVYKHKLALGIYHQEEAGSKSTSASNQHGQWSDPQMLDGSSSCCHSGGSREALVEILKRDAKNGKSDGSESFDKDGERHWALNSSHGSQQGSGVSSPAMVKTLLLDSGVLSGIPLSKPSSAERKMEVKNFKEASESANVDSEVGGENLRIEEKLVREKYYGVMLEPQESVVLESDLVPRSKKNSPGLVGQQNSLEHLDSNGSFLTLKNEDQSQNDSNLLPSLLPPPLPKTPSESWLSRALPSVSSKAPSGQSILSIHVLQRKQAIHSSSTNPKQESDAKLLESRHSQISCAVSEPEIPGMPSKRQQCLMTTSEPSEESSIKPSKPLQDQILDATPSKQLRRQIRFADVLMTPLSPRSEM